MNKVAIVYWSGTGNTETMANLIAEGVKQSGGEANIFAASEFGKDLLSNYTAFAFGCPSMGSEELEDSEFKPMWDEVENLLTGKKVILFGSYGWGDGEWMRNWEEQAACEIMETFICNEAPTQEQEVICRQLGSKLV